MDSLATLRVYKELAEWYERQGQPAMRDRFLILAAEAAFSSGKPDEAERLRQRLLQGNPHHMLKPFSSFAQALQSSNVQIYIHDLQTNYPPETALGLLKNQPGVAEQTVSIPTTAPLIEIHDEPTLPLDNTVESLKVYPLREEPPAKPSLPAAVPPTHLQRPSRPKPPSAPSAEGRPANAPKPNPAVPRTPSAAPRQPEPKRPARPAIVAEPSPSPAHSEPVAPSGAWLTLLLFGMTVTAGAALAVYTLARPFLPASWLP